MTKECQDEVNKITAEAGGYWVYSYYDDCWYENEIRRFRKLISTDEHKKEREQGVFEYHGPPQSKKNPSYLKNDKSRIIDIPNGYACGGPIAQIEYLSIPVVKEALHVPQEAQFFQSDNGVGFTYEFTEHDLISWYKEIIAENKLKILVYNGDTDPCINAFQAQNWTRNLGFKETQSWRPWTTDNCQRMGGYVTRYENNFDFLTIKGSGHMVPQFKPAAALSFIKSFVMGTEYDFYDPECTGDNMDVSSTYYDNDEQMILSELKKGINEWSRKESILNEKLDKILKNKK